VVDWLSHLAWRSAIRYRRTVVPLRRPESSDGRTGDAVARSKSKRSLMSQRLDGGTVVIASQSSTFRCRGVGGRPYPGRSLCLRVSAPPQSRGFVSAAQSQWCLRAASRAPVAHAHARWQGQQGRGVRRGAARAGLRGLRVRRRRGRRDRCARADAPGRPRGPARRGWSGRARSRRLPRPGRAP
jgi:hypothetical protein